MQARTIDHHKESARDRRKADRTPSTCEKAPAELEKERVSLYPI
jgi:hypothetical protein